MSILRALRPSTDVKTCLSFYKRRGLSSKGPLRLKYDVYEPPHGRHGASPLLICHGLLGSKRNWQSLGKVFAKRLGRPVYALDLRNHGNSPHSQQHDYNSMASDVLHFCEEHSLRNISLLGHSMGGKAVMAFALNPNLPNGLLSHLIVADIAPIRGKLSNEFTNYIEGMLKVEAERLAKSKKEAFKLLEDCEKDELIRHFLLTNLAPTHEGEPVKFHVPLRILKESLDNLGWFPFEPGEASWDGPTLFIKGSRSNYIKEKHTPIMKEFFPNMTLKTLDASHWLHYERPKEFVDAVEGFLKDH